MLSSLRHGHIVLDGDPAPLPKKWAEPSPKFSANVHCGQAPGWIKVALGTEVGLGPGYIVLDRDPAPQPQKASQFSAHFYYGQTAGCIKMPLGMEVGLSPGEFVRWEPSHLPKKGAEPLPNFKG